MTIWNHLTKTIRKGISLVAIAGMGAVGGLMLERRAKEYFEKMDEPERARLLTLMNDLITEQMKQHGSTFPACEDCGAFGHGYMVTDHLWQHATRDKPAKLLCLLCVEKRVKMNLTQDDFIQDAPINLPIFAAMAIGHRSGMMKDKVHEIRERMLAKAFLYSGDPA